jgi:hypothetical protein
MSLLDALLEDELLASELPLRQEVWLAIRTDSDGIGDGSRENPFSANTPTSFAAAMNQCGANTTVHLGPGIFRTRGTNGNGYSDLLPSQRWVPQAGQKIVGSGMFATTLMFVWDLDPALGDAPGQRHYMISSPEFLSSFEISDMTLDCNLQNTPFEPDRKLTVTALAIAGDNALVRRIRVINFGTRTPFTVDGENAPSNATYEGFPLRIGGRTVTVPSFNSVMEDCIFEQPHTGPAREVTCVTVVGGIAVILPSEGLLHLQPLGCVARNCYLNFDFINPRAGNPVPITSISFAGSPSTATVGTQFPHNLEPGDYVEIYGSDVAALNGRFAATVLDATDGTSRRFSFVIGSTPAAPTTRMIAFKSTQPTMPAASVERTGSTVTISTASATSVTVNGAAASRYSDATFAAAGLGLVNGTNTFTAVASDAFGRRDTNSVSIGQSYVPVSLSRRTRACST